MIRADFDLKKIPKEIASSEWIENESIVKGVFFKKGKSSGAWVGLKAPTLDGNELWLVEEQNLQELQSQMGFKKPLEKVFEITSAQALSLLDDIK